MTTVSQNKALVERFNKEFVAGKQMQTYHELVSPAFLNHAAPPGKQGFDDAIAFFEQVLWPALSGLSVEILDQVGEADRIVTRKLLRGVQKQEFMGIPASGAPIQIKVIDIFRIDQGKLAEHWAIVDMHDLQLQTKTTK
jgi:predicted ester cyclase